MFVGFILVWGNGMLRPPPGGYRSSPCDEYDAKVPHTFRREEQKSVMLLIALPIVSVGHGAVQQTTRLVHLDCECICLRIGA